MHIVAVTEHNLSVYLNLAQAYEAEFSLIMQKPPQANGAFALDTELGDRVTGYLLYVDGIPAGLAAVSETSPRQFNLCEFYVVPYFRGNKTGYGFATELFSTLGGVWQIKQVAGAEYASQFWRKVLNQYTHGHFDEDTFSDPKWGVVTRQQFSHPAMNKASAVLA